MVLIIYSQKIRNHTAGYGPNFPMSLDQKMHQRKRAKIPFAGSGYSSTHGVAKVAKVHAEFSTETRERKIHIAVYWDSETHVEKANTLMT